MRKLTIVEHIEQADRISTRALSSRWPKQTSTLELNGAAGG